MNKNNLHIEIVRSTTKGLSSLSKLSCDSIYELLAKHFTKIGITIVNNLADLEALTDTSPDLVFLGMEYILNYPEIGLTDSNKVWLSDYFDDHKIAYTGSKHTAHELGRNKHLAKQCAINANLSTSAYVVIKQDQSFDINDIPLTFPLFIKPTNRGGGCGIDSDSVAHNFNQARSKVQYITSKLNSDVLIEEYLPGREFSVAILKDDLSNEYFTLPIELVAPLDKYGIRLLSSKIKSANSEQALEVTDINLKTKVTDLALAVFDALGARDYGRIDIRLDTNGIPHFLEANLIPSLISGYGSFPKACVLNIGLKYESMIMRIVNLGLAHKMSEIKNILEPETSNNSIYTPSQAVFESV